MLISLYRTPFRTKRYYLRIFAYLLDLSICNAWLLARRDAKILGINYSKSLEQFRLEVSSSLLLANRVPRRGRPFADAESPEKIRRPMSRRPQNDIRYDGVAHWPIDSDKGRCRNCRTGWSRMKCSKCDVLLCWTNQRNCFYDFHNHV